MNHLSNVTGYILPIDRLSALTHQYNGKIICDGAQALGLIEVDLEKSKIDYYCFTGHKNLYGVFGCGGIMCRGELEIEPRLYGGTGSDSLNLKMPERGNLRYEASSPNVNAIGILETSIQWLMEKNIYEHEKNLTTYLVETLNQIDEIQLHLPSSKSHIAVVSFTVEGYKSSEVAEILDLDFNISVRSGYHCCPKIHQYLGDTESSGTIRISLSYFNTKKDIDRIVAALEELLV